MLRISLPLCLRRPAIVVAAALIASGLGLVVTPAAAVPNIIYTLNDPTAPSPYQNWGTVALENLAGGNSVRVTVTLAIPPSSVFANASGFALSYNLLNEGVIAYSNMTPGFLPAPPPNTAAPYGTFEHAVCWGNNATTPTACGTGTSPPTSSGPLVFDVTDTGGGLIGLGIPEFEARRYEGKLKDGNILISVHTESSEEITRAEDIFTRAGAQDICTTGETTAPDQGQTTEVITYPTESISSTRAA